MKGKVINKRNVPSFISIIFLCTLALAQTGPSRPLFIQPESKLWLEGKSTLHDYSFSNSEITGTIELDSSYYTTKDLTEIKNLFSQVEIVIPVKKIRSENEKMNENMYEALKAEEHPNILFRLIESGIVSDSSRRNQGPEIKIKGKLSVAGKENIIEMNVTLAKGENGSLGVRGSKELLMTDFNIDPPSFMLGILKTDNRVVVKFDLLLSTQKNKQ